MNDRWRGLESLVHDLVDATTALVGEGHASVGRNLRRVTDRVHPPLSAPIRAVEEVNEATLAVVRAANRLVERAAGLAWDAAGRPDGPQEIALRSDITGSPAWVADALIGALNGFAGDHLAATGNPLALGMRLRAEPPDRERVVVLVHGLSTTEWSWALGADAGDPGATFGTRLAADAGWAPVYARYNSGRPVRVNGRLLAEALDAFVAERLVAEIALVGHSMGGLVARSACAHGGAWLPRVRHVVTLGTPHQGAPLARLAAVVEQALGAVDAPGTRIVSKIMGVRSGGIRDLEDGRALSPIDDEAPPIPGIRYSFLSGSVAGDADGLAAGWLGDGMVSPVSASGPSDTFPSSGARFGGVAHHRIQCDPAVYRHLLGLLREVAP